VPRDEQRTALALAQRLAEATGDTTVVTAALLARYMATAKESSRQPNSEPRSSSSGSSSNSDSTDGTGGLSVDAVRDLVGADAANTAAQCAAMLHLHVESRELIWSDPSMQRLTLEQADNMQNSALIHLFVPPGSEQLLRLMSFPPPSPPSFYSTPFSVPFCFLPSKYICACALICSLVRVHSLSPVVQWFCRWPPTGGW